MSRQCRVIRNVAQIADVAPAWRDLARICGPAMNDPVWHVNAARFAHRTGDEPRILTVWCDEQLAALAPLILTRAGGAPRYEIIGSRALHEPAEILVRDSQAAGSIADEIARLDRPVLLARLPVRSDFNDAFAHRARGAGLVLSSHSSGSPFVDLGDGWDRYYAGLPSRIRNIVRRGYRQLCALGQVSFEFLQPNEAEAPEVLRRAFEVELQSWKGRAGSAILLRDDLREFFLHYGAETAARGELLVSFLYFEGNAIAMQVANVARRAYWQLKIGYDERHSKYLPGLQLLLETIRWSFEQRLDTYEFLGTDEAWIREWTGQVRAHTNTIFYPFNASGVGGLLRDGLTRMRRKLRGRRAEER